MLPFGSAKGKAFKITGSYILDKYDDNLEKWLDSMDINGGEMGPIFRDTKVKLMVQEPSKYNKKWNIAHKEEGETDTDRSLSYTFETGKAFSHHSSDEVQRLLVTADSDSKNHNVIKCLAEVPNKSWDVETKITFTSEGITAVMTNRKANVSTTCFYVRQMDPWTAKKRKLLLIKKL